MAPAIDETRDRGNNVPGTFGCLPDVFHAGEGGSLVVNAGEDMGNRLEGAAALITGGSGGIGAATARLFWEEGGSVAIVDLDQEAVDATARDISPDGQRVAAIAADLVDESQAAAAVQETIRRFGSIDVLANVAAIRVYGPVTEATSESWDRIIDVNLRAVANCCKHAIPAMAHKGGGSIINVSSANAMVGRGGMAQYDASKSALLALTRSMACDHAGDGIRVNTVSPGPTLTPFHVRNRSAKTGESLAEAEAAMRASGSAKTLLGRQAEPVEIAYAILFLASRESSYVTGANFPIDGGLSGLRS
jgi:NAD(P)-dependent dehydrogenase (short-subunit alcohol dehydrogenase family)